MFNSIFTLAVGLYCADAIVKKVKKDTKKIVKAVSSETKKERR